MDNDKKSLDNQDIERKARIKDLQSARDALKPDAPNYEKTNNDYVQAQIEYQAWRQIALINLQRMQKLQMTQLFNKITASVAEVATKKGIDLVLAEQRPDFPDNIEQLTVEQVRGLITARNVLYVSGNVDITTEVVTSMDQKYKAGK